MHCFFSGLYGFYWNTTKTAYVGTGIPGNDSTQLNSPVGLFFDSNENLYVGDVDNHRVMKFAPDSTNGTVVAGTTGSGGQGLYQLGSREIYVYIDSRQHLYVADRDSHRVLRYTNGNNTGTVVAGGGGATSASNQFRDPHGIWVDTQSNLFVSDRENHRIMKWIENATIGILVAGVSATAGI